MSFVGGPYEYDVFVSYVRSQEETGSSKLREWSTFVAGELRDSLGSAINDAAPPDRRFEMFLDENRLQSGESLSTSLKDAVEKTAILLVVLTPLYANKPWCMDELRWFLEKARRDGRGTSHCQIIYIKPIEDSNWPKELLDERGKRLLYDSFIEEPPAGKPPTDLPIGFERPQEDRELAEKVLGLHSEILQKLKELRKQTAARQAYQAEARQALPNKPVLYLEARPQDQEPWATARAKLGASDAFVLPASLTDTRENDGALLQKRREERFKIVSECNGFVLLRTDPQDEHSESIVAAYQDMKRVYDLSGRHVPWALIDGAPEAPLPAGDIFKIPRVPLAASDWPARLLNELNPKPDET